MVIWESSESQFGRHKKGRKNLRHKLEFRNCYTTVTYLLYNNCVFSTGFMYHRNTYVELKSVHSVDSKKDSKHHLRAQQLSNSEPEQKIHLNKILSSNLKNRSKNYC